MNNLEYALNVLSRNGSASAPCRMTGSTDPHPIGVVKTEGKSAKRGYKPDSVQRGLAPAPWQPFL